MFRYNGKKYEVIKEKFSENLKGLLAQQEGINYICINSLLSKQEQQKVLHDILKGRKLKNI